MYGMLAEMGRGLYRGRDVRCGVAVAAASRQDAEQQEVSR